jgi:4-amino-4-deoxy-L-arabinose transferase-like glycosyltransferase
MTRSARKTVILAVLLLIAFAQRVGFAAGEYRFHPDEALFSTFARRAALNGDWLLHGDLDKPPLSIYANALSMLLFAARPRETVLDFMPLQGEFAARLPTLFASLITIAAGYGTIRRLFPGSPRGLWSAVLIAGSPLAIVFGATAFTDGLMICAGALAGCSPHFVG